MGAKDEIGQLKKVKCTYKHCQMRFDTEKEMRYHKRDDPDHFYCKKCNVDCEDWNDLKAHKVAAMAPWVEGRMKGNKDESPMHIVCEFCGMDFKSFGGRKIHREQQHQADQRIVCPGCKTIFTRAGNYLAHFEGNQCPCISRLRFLDYVQEKHVHGQILEIKNVLESNQETYESAGLIGAGHEDTEEGGINLIDDGEDADQSAGFPPLKAEVQLLEMRQSYQQPYKRVEEYPRLPSSSMQQLTESTRKLSMASTTANSGPDSPMSASEFASQITSRRGGIKVQTESCSSPLSLSTRACMSDEDDMASIASTAMASPSNVSEIWSGNTSQVLFKGAKATPPPADYERMLQRREEEAEAHPNNDLMRARFWDPSWEHFNANVFKKWDEEYMVEVYQCPFPGCNQVSYTMDIDLADHLRQSHFKARWRCPLCLKIFKNPSALVSHSEAAGKCKVKTSSKYGDLLKELSGGLLEMEHLSQPKIAKYTDGEEAGIMTTKFTAKSPRKDVRW